MVFDTGSESDARALERLATDTIGWLTTRTWSASRSRSSTPAWTPCWDGAVIGESTLRLLATALPPA